MHSSSLSSHSCENNYLTHRQRIHSRVITATSCSYEMQDPVRERGETKHAIWTHCGQQQQPPPRGRALDADPAPPAFLTVGNMKDCMRSLMLGLPRQASRSAFICSRAMLICSLCLSLSASNCSASCTESQGHHIRAIMTGINGSDISGGRAELIIEQKRAASACGS